MKKFWIIFSIVMAILIGINGFLFIPNNFAMTTVISQNTQKIISLTEDAVKNLNKQNYLDMTIKTFKRENEFYSVTTSSNVKLLKDNLNYIFTASVLTVFVESEDEGETFETKKREYNVYYNKGDFYWHILEDEKQPENKGLKIKDEGVHIEVAISNSLGFDYSLLFGEFDKSMLNDNPFNANSSMLLTFKPFIFGQKFKYDIKDELRTEFYEYYVSMFGNFKKYVYKLAGENYAVFKEITYNSFNKFTIVAPSGLNDYTEPPGP